MSFLDSNSQENSQDYDQPSSSIPNWSNKGNIINIMCETQTSKTESILHLCLEDLLELVWQGVAEKNVAKMAPKAMNS